MIKSKLRSATFLIAMFCFLLPVASIQFKRRDTAALVNYFEKVKGMDLVFGSFGVDKNEKPRFVDSNLPMLGAFLLIVAGFVLGLKHSHQAGIAGFVVGLSATALLVIFSFTIVPSLNSRINRAAFTVTLENGYYMLLGASVLATLVSLAYGMGWYGPKAEYRSERIGRK